MLHSALEKVRTASLAAWFSHGLAARGIYYIVDNAGWSIDWDGAYITKNTNLILGRRVAKTSKGFRHLRNQVVHFGTLGSYSGGGYACHVSNRVVATVFHGDHDTDNAGVRQQIGQLSQHLDRPDYFVTASSIMAERLARWGVDEGRLRRIPLGVDLETFSMLPESKRRALREHLGIPSNAVCIGSFQKDGNGWGEGLEPKLMKGPDIFVEAVCRLADSYPVFVLLTGPARGYVKSRLSEHGIPYRHVYVSDYGRICEYYNCLDLYLVTSREEGGPKALTESMATGVPLVSTRVGMAPDMIEHGVNGWLADVEDTEGIVECAAQAIENSDLRRSIVEAALQTVGAFDWHVIASRYCQEVYVPLLERL